MHKYSRKRRVKRPPTSLISPFFKKKLHIHIKKTNNVFLYTHIQTLWNPKTFFAHAIGVIPVLFMHVWISVYFLRSKIACYRRNELSFLAFLHDFPNTQLGLFSSIFLFVCFFFVESFSFNTTRMNFHILFSFLNLWGVFCFLMWQRPHPSS